MPKRKLSASSLRSTCPIAGALDLLGDRWTLLVIRDLVPGGRRYGNFAGSAEGIPTNVLADRLARLEKAGLIKSEPYQDNPPRYLYTLTEKGSALKPVVASLAMWGSRHISGTRIPSEMAAMLQKTSSQ